MKKTVTTCVLCGCLAIGSTFAQTAKKDVNHISFGLKGGYNYLLLSDRTQFATEINPSFGAFFELTANPLWSAGIEYLYMGNNQTRKADDSEFKAAMHGLTYFNSINITNLVAKGRSAGWQKFNVFGTLGGGVGFYNYKFEGSDKETGAQPIVTAGLSMEYNLAKWFALGLESQYRYNPDVQFMPVYKGTSNLCGLNLTARIKLGGDKNVRNMACSDFCQKPTAAPDNSAALNQQKQRINQLENTVANQDEDIQTLQQQIKDLQNKLAQKPAVVAQPQQTPVPEKEVVYLEFKLNSSTIVKPNAQLDALAVQLKQNPTWKVTLTGYTDNTGTDAVNNRLSKQRADAAKMYLVNKGVPASAVTTEGKGSANPLYPNDTRENRAKNRRVEIEVKQ